MIKSILLFKVFLLIGVIASIANSGFVIDDNPLQNNLRVDSIRHGPLPPLRISICSGRQRGDWIKIFEIDAETIKEYESPK
jgi:hypothetical protein